jgi:hypothetical protein
MDHRGIEYSVVQLTDGLGWRWEVKFGNSTSKAGLTRVSRTVAIKEAENEIDHALKDG